MPVLIALVSGIMEPAKSFERLGLSSWVPILAATLICYAILCSSLRFRRIHKMRSRLGYTDRASLSRMTNKDSREIVQQITQYEFPFCYDLSLRFAVFKVIRRPLAK